MTRFEEMYRKLLLLHHTEDYSVTSTAILDINLVKRLEACSFPRITFKFIPSDITEIAIRQKGLMVTEN
jgi:hypothetical protein